MISAPPTRNRLRPKRSERPLTDLDRGSSATVLRRFGRKRFLVGGALIMGVFTLLSSLVSSFGLLLILRAIAGAGASVIFPNVNATLGDNFPYRERGRAISTVIAFNTMASVIGIPIAGIVAEATSWRVSLALVGLLAVAAATLLLFQLKPAQVHVNESRVFELYRTILGIVRPSRRSSPACSAVSTGSPGRRISSSSSRTDSAIGGRRIDVGAHDGSGRPRRSQVGGRIGDRYGHRPVVASAIVVSGALLLVQTNVGLPLLVTSALNLVLSAVIGARFATNSTLLTEQVPEARGTLSRALRCDRKSQHRRWRGRRGAAHRPVGFWQWGSSVWARRCFRR